jgi:hypothetical protein
MGVRETQKDIAAETKTERERKKAPTEVLLELFAALTDELGLHRVEDLGRGERIRSILSNHPVV